MRAPAVLSLLSLGAAGLAACTPTPAVRSASICEVVARGAEMAGQRVRVTGTFRGDPRAYGTIEDGACPGRRLAFTGWAGVAGSDLADEWLAEIERARLVSSADELSSDFRIEATGVYIARPIASEGGQFQVTELHDFERLEMSEGDRAVYEALEGAEAPAATEGVSIPPAR